MKNSLPILLSLAASLSAVDAGGQSAKEATAAPADKPAFTPYSTDVDLRPLRPPAPNELVELAAALPACKSSLVAAVRLTADVYGRRVTGTGRFAQSLDPIPQMHYDLQLEVNGLKVRRLEVNDGRYLWRNTQFGDAPDVERIDLERLAVLHKKAGCETSDNTSAQLALGGVGRLLETLGKDFEFYEVFPFQLHGRPVFGVEGRWRSEVLAQLKVDTAERLRPHVPDRVTVYLGCDDLFPYRIDFHRTGAAGQGRGATMQPYLSLEFDDVQFNARPDAAHFQFEPIPKQFLDATERTAARGKQTP